MTWWGASEGRWLLGAAPGPSWTPVIPVSVSVPVIVTEAASVATTRLISVPGSLHDQ